MWLGRQRIHVPSAQPREHRHRGESAIADQCAVLCSDGPVTSLVELTLTAEHRRRHGEVCDAVHHGWLEPRRLRRLLASTPLPRAADGRIVLAVDVSNWLRPDAPTSPELLFRHVYERGRSADQFIPGWPYSFVAALETERTS